MSIPRFRLIDSRNNCMVIASDYDFVVQSYISEKVRALYERMRIATQTPLDTLSGNNESSIKEMRDQYTVYEGLQNKIKEYPNNRSIRGSHNHSTGFYNLYINKDNQFYKRVCNYVDSLIKLTNLITKHNQL